MAFYQIYFSNLLPGGALVQKYTIEMYNNIRTVHSESSGVKLTRFQMVVGTDRNAIC